MTEPNASSDFYVAVVAAADEDDLTADIVYSGEMVAHITRIDGDWTLITYASSEDGRQMPLDGFRTALEDAVARVQLT